MAFGGCPQSLAADHQRPPHGMGACLVGACPPEIVDRLALFYAGLVRTKNVLATIMHRFAILCLVTLLWIFVGYSLAFRPDHGGLIGGLEWIGLIGVGTSHNPTYASTIPHQTFMVFQLRFAAITPTLIISACAERMRFSALFWPPWRSD